MMNMAQISISHFSSWKLPKSKEKRKLLQTADFIFCKIKRKIEPAASNVCARPVKAPAIGCKPHKTKHTETQRRAGELRDSTSQKMLTITTNSLAAKSNVLKCTSLIPSLKACGKGSQKREACSEVYP